MSASARKRRLIERISGFSSTEQHEIFKMLVRHGVPYTANRNGVFFNMSDVPPDVVMDMESVVDFYSKNKAALDELEQRITEYRHSKEEARTPDARGSGRAEETVTVNKAYDALLTQVASGPRSVRARQVSKFSIAKKRFAKKQQAANESRQRSLFECDADDILHPEPTIISHAGA